jgi:hypothetical protein
MYHTPSARTTTTLSVLLVILGIGAAAVALLGPLGFDFIEYRNSAGAINQTQGGDVAGILLVAPLCIWAAVLVARRHAAGAVLALGPALYGSYVYIQLGFVGDVTRYDGNSERFFPLFTGLLIVAGVVAWLAWRSIDVEALPIAGRRIVRSFGWFVLFVAAFLVVGLHIPGMIAAWAATPPSEYLADPSLFWLVKLMDLVIVVPALTIVGIGVLRRAKWANASMYAVAGWTALLASSVAGMAIVMQIEGDAGASMAYVAAFGAFALIAIGFAVAIYRPLFAPVPAEPQEASVTGERMAASIIAG